MKLFSGKFQIREVILRPHGVKWTSSNFMRLNDLKRETHLTSHESVSTHLASSNIRKFYVVSSNFAGVNQLQSNPWTLSIFGPKLIGKLSVLNGRQLISPSSQKLALYNVYGNWAVREVFSPKKAKKHEILNVNQWFAIYSPFYFIHLHFWVWKTKYQVKCEFFSTPKSVTEGLGWVGRCRGVSSHWTIDRLVSIVNSNFMNHKNPFHS